MIAGPVDWGVHGGEYLEKVMAVFVAQDHPDAIRRTPSSGDGGVDILVRHGTAWEVLQVKGFNDRLRDSERRQISHSWDLFCEDPRLDGPIEAWRLVCPIDLTSGEQAWFEELTADAPHEVTYRGVVFWDKMAADHPHVVDYFFGGGRDRVAQRSTVLRSAFEDPLNPLSPDDAVASLEMLRAQLSREDPHYRYEFLTGDRPPQPEELPECVMASTQSVRGGGFVTLTVHARHRYSTEDWPITGGFTLQSPSVEANDEFLEAVDGFLTLGRALELDAGVIDFELSGPLATTSKMGGIRVGPALVETGATKYRLGVDDPSGARLAEVTLVRQSLTRGAAGGAELVLTDDNGVVTFTMQVRPTRDPLSEHAGTVNVNLSSEFSGHPAVHAVTIAELHQHLLPGNLLSLRGEFGDEPLWAVPLQDDSMAIAEGQAAVVQMLARLQPLTREPVLVPEDVTVDLFRLLQHELKMLDGEATSGTWTQATVELDQDGDDLPSLSGGTPVVSFDRERSITVGDVVVPLGVYRFRFASARLESSGSESTLVFRPSDDNTCEVTRLGDTGSQPEGVHLDTGPD